MNPFESETEQLTLDDWRERMARVIMGDLQANRNERDAENILTSLEADLKERRDAIGAIDRALTVQKFFLRALGDVWEEMYQSGHHSMVCDDTMRSAVGRAIFLLREERTKVHLSASGPKSKIRGLPSVYNSERDSKEVSEVRVKLANRQQRQLRGYLHEVKHKKRD